MRRWPSYRVWQKQERRRRISKFAFSIADHLPDWDVGPLPYLKLCAKHRQEESQHMSVRCPDGIRVKPAFTSYYDVFYTEDLPALQQGLTHWCCERIGQSQPFIGQPKNYLNELFRDWSHRPIGGAWSRIGQVHTKPADGLRCVKFISMDLIHMSPDCVLLLISAFPTSGYIQRFQDLISRDVSDTTIIHRTGWFSGRWYCQSLLPSAVRQREVEEFFLEMNHEIVDLLRRYIGRGWSARGPLPCVQVFALEDFDEHSDATGSNSEFWRSLSLNRIPELSYSNNEGIEIVPPDLIDKGTFTAPYRCIVDARRYLTEERAKHYATREYALFFNLENTLLRPLVPLFALREMGRRSLNTLTSLRSRVSPHIVLGRGFMSRLRRIVGVLIIPPQLNSLQFESSRLRESSISRLLDCPPTLPFIRKTHSQQDARHLTDDLVREIQLLIDHLVEQLALIRSVYQDIWNFAIQWILLVLTIVATVIAVAQLVPRRERADTPTKATLSTEQGTSEVGPSAESVAPDN